MYLDILHHMPGLNTEIQEYLLQLDHMLLLIVLEFLIEQLARTVRASSQKALKINLDVSILNGRSRPIESTDCMPCRAKHTHLRYHSLCLTVS